MGNCLVTKLKENVNNDNLPVFAEFQFTLKGSATKVRIDVVDAVSAEIEGSGYFVNRQDENIGKKVNNYDGDRFWLMGVADDDIIKFKSIYDITQISFLDTVVNIKSNSLVNLNYAENITSLNLGNQNTPSFNLNEFFKTNKVLTYFRNPYNGNLVGAVETVVENQLSLGRTSGTINIGGGHSNVTFHNVSFEVANLSWVTIEFTSSVTANVYSGEGTSGTLLATYNNGAWTYNN